MHQDAPYTTSSTARRRSILDAPVRRSPLGGLRRAFGGDGRGGQNPPYNEHVLAGNATMSIAMKKSRLRPSFLVIVLLCFGWLLGIISCFSIIEVRSRKTFERPRLYSLPSWYFGIDSFSAYCSYCIKDDTANHYFWVDGWSFCGLSFGRLQDKKIRACLRMRVHSLLVIASLLACTLITTRKMISRTRTCTAYPCCMCSYSLLGNQSGICPECGTPIDPKQIERIRSVNSVSTNPTRQETGESPKT